jgi:hypothetical protein
LLFIFFSPVQFYRQSTPSISFVLHILLFHFVFEYFVHRDLMKSSAIGEEDDPIRGAEDVLRRSLSDRSIGFRFRHRDERINWRVLMNFDVERMVEDVDVEALQSVLENVTFGDLFSEGMSTLNASSVSFSYPSHIPLISLSYYSHIPLTSFFTWVIWSRINDFFGSSCNETPSNRPICH